MPSDAMYEDVHKRLADVSTACLRGYRVCSMRGWKEEGKWLKAARELDFTPEQRKRVLGARDEALGILHECAPPACCCLSSLAASTADVP
jgi:hypothetical protein